jgi:hypothetical protein
MINLSRRYAFAVGFICTLLLFVVANIYSFHETSIADGFDTLGFPFDLWIQGGYASIRRILWRGLAADALIAINTGVNVGFLLSRLLGRKRKLM